MRYLYIYMSVICICVCVCVLICVYFICVAVIVTILLNDSPILISIMWFLEMETRKCIDLLGVTVDDVKGCKSFFPTGKHSGTSFTFTVQINWQCVTPRGSQFEQWCPSGRKLTFQPGLSNTASANWRKFSRSGKDSKSTPQGRAIHIRQKKNNSLNASIVSLTSPTLIVRNRSSTERIGSSFSSSARKDVQVQLQVWTRPISAKSKLVFNVGKKKRNDESDQQLNWRQYIT